MSTEKIVSLNILDKKYKIICTEEEQANLVMLAEQLDLQMREIKHTGKVSGGERMAVLAALNLSHELMQPKETNSTMGSTLNKKLSKMYLKIETALKNV
ncbi:MAG: cell division protein ZapA [Methyloprofundus sp.]|nr:cell division protein ZapA [Methyloprofundus sp.]